MSTAVGDSLCFVYIISSLFVSCWPLLLLDNVICNFYVHGLRFLYCTVLLELLNSTKVILAQCFDYCSVHFIVHKIAAYTVLLSNGFLVFFSLHPCISILFTNLAKTFYLFQENKFNSVLDLSISKLFIFAWINCIPYFHLPQIQKITFRFLKGKYALKLCSSCIVCWHVLTLFWVVTLLVSRSLVLFSLEGKCLEHLDESLVSWWPQQN